ncbi:mitochondrial DNA polymerase a, putative [Ichthyophthirius multifiliis]|uniref:Mitochondrial DNA polymerase a, putative n=1 Tax=Ichthyophthirius multifiliis TaxID=5932 RepID=G0R152_ICHMU|nr:mitochondrial DNA polymerase a, putative [Ichthyophthirius multifiliis]EGR28819.1 mitochondrial DNA polymerase a, putative [Ichthyophthirius multifiliis]|eukprot:XP_004030055.1 mitochondrial DNA polymerase a, putative [Ichthyophthirius multifiliis]
MTITGLGLEVQAYTEKGMPSVDLPLLKELAGNPEKGNYGKIGEYYKERKEEEKGKVASRRDFHSRIAVTLFPYISTEVQQGKILIDQDQDLNNSNIPLLKDKYGSERKKAKILNFSIIYGASAKSITEALGCSFKEAQEMIDKWYQEAPEVNQWQDKVKNIALEKGYTQTLMGRYRNLSKFFNQNQGFLNKLHGLRAAINTPIQGGGADFVIAAMVKISQSQKLEQLGFELILQIHDELILEGPQENAQESKYCIIKTIYDQIIII